MSRDKRNFFQKKLYGKPVGTGKRGISEKEDKKCETEAGEIPCGAWENRLKRAENRTGKEQKERAEKEQNLCIRDRVKLFFGRL